LINYDDLMEVTSERLFAVDGTPDENGLLSQKIFGPINKHKCLCGNYASKVLYDSKKCPKCGVLCTGEGLRNTTFAKISLDYPIYRYSSLSKLQKLTGRLHSSILNPVLRDMVASMELYLIYDIIEDSFSIDEIFIPNDKNSTMITIPIAIAGTFSLYISLNVAARLGSALARKYLSHFQFNVPVIPPNSRPSTTVTAANGKSKSKYIHELDTMYVNILHKRNFLPTHRLASADSEELIDTVFKSLHCVTPVIIDDMVLYETEQSKVQYYVNKLYETAQDTLSGKDGLIRHDFLGKIIDFSARAVISPNPQLQAYKIKLPLWLFIKLWFIEYLWYLAEIEGIEILNVKEIMRNADGIKKETNSIHEFVSYFFKNSSRQNRLIFINRQPTLWRYGMPVVEIAGISTGNTIETSPIFLDPLNGDYDGDTMALYRVHDHGAVIEMEQNAFILNTIKYDHNDEYLHTIKDETFFYLKIFTDTVNQDSTIEGEFTLDNISVDENNIKLFDHMANIDGESISVGLALINTVAKFNKIVIKPGISRQSLSKLIYRDSSTNEEYFERLNSISNFLNCAGLILGNHTITLPVIECNNIVNMSRESDLLNNLPNHPVIGFMVYRSVVANIMTRLPVDSQMHKFRKTKFGETQFSRSLVAIGYVSDHNNITSGAHIRNSTFGGLTEDEFFRTSYGARKGITDKDKVVPESGYLERSMVMNFSPVEICEEDCGTTYGFPINIVSAEHANSLIGRYYTSTGSTVWTKLETDQAKDLIGEDIIVRSPITCITPHHKICKKCFGDYELPGPFVGLIAGQYLAERLTQLSLRTFHTSGSATYNFSDELYKFFIVNLIEIKHHVDYFSLHFKNTVPHHLIKEIKEITHDTYIDVHSSPDVLSFNELSFCENDDVSTVLNAVKSQMRAETNLEYTCIQDSYSILMHNVLNLGFIKSVYIEIALCNAFINNKSQTFRYGIKEAQETGGSILPVSARLNVKGIHRYISPLLSLLYEPNAKSIHNIHDARTDVAVSPEEMTIFERIWMSEL